VGQLDKRTTQQDVASLLEEFGPIESINVSFFTSMTVDRCDCHFYEIKDLRSELKFAQVYGRCGYKFKNSD
jgi:hypothetical protein